MESKDQLERAIEEEHQRLIADTAAADATAGTAGVPLLHRRTLHHHHSHQASHGIKSGMKWQDVVDDVPERTEFRSDRASAVDSMQDDLAQLQEALLIAKSVQEMTGNAQVEGDAQVQGIPRSRCVEARVKSPVVRLAVRPGRHSKKIQVSR